MKYFNPKRPMKPFKQWEAEMLNRRMGATFTPYRRNHDANVATCDAVVGACVKGETKIAHGAREPRRGGVIPGMGAFTYKR